MKHSTLSGSLEAVPAKYDVRQSNGIKGSVPSYWLMQDECEQKFV
jgi:hypothetical protein